ncbi:Oidioi.mRNA.OKI2018_I69.chr2.g4144.t1.cds [Oikopleura dioica]|uniref:Oidioi.mRNA.OKI2018_I69.chr2.g4144.t1.cds n=1 Tax=Oikopleura dioica TaxID=34765 RepID=A0ABN7SWE1_OIKDI|nr:Oidioi.mRNA.OKI2018_I69.chr2.g4144.t1.cds [Oikopleura dioica]
MNLASVLCVRDTLPNGLAAQNYVKNDDIIVQLNGHSTVNMSERWAVNEISKSSRLVLTIDRQNELAPVNLELTRNPGQGFGFSLGNRIFIDAIKEDSIAGRYLEVYDIILQVDELDCTNKPLNQVKQRVANDQNRTLILTVEKGFQGPPTTIRSGSPANYLIPNSSFNTTTLR